MDASVRRLGRELARIEKQTEGLGTTPQLPTSSVEGGALPFNDAEGATQLIVGEQFDGAHVVLPVSGPDPSMPSVPRIHEGIESLTVQWDGFFVNEEGVIDETIFAGTNYSRMEVHLSLDPAFDAFTADTLKGTIESPRGGEVVIAPLEGGKTYYARLVPRSTHGSAGPQSWMESATPMKSSEILLDHIDASVTIIDNAADMLIDAADGGTGQTVGNAINDAATSPVTDARLQPGTLTVWPFTEQTVPSGALEPGAVGEDDIADFAIAVKKLNTKRHMLF